MIMNLKQIRKEKIYDKWISVSKNGEFGCPDQEVIDIVCKKRILYLPLKYNFHPRSCAKLIDKDSFSPREWQDLDYHMVMIHYVSGWKPWVEKDRPPFSDIWWKYAKQTRLF